MTDISTPEASIHTAAPPSMGRNARWLATAQLAKTLVQLVGLGVLSRLLSPADFGVMALATIVTNLAGLLRDMGTGPAIIRSRALTPTMVNSIFWLNVISGSVIALVIVLFSIPLARLFNSVSLSAVLCWLALTFPVMSLGAAHQALLERDSRFRTVARSDVLSYSCGMSSAVIAAYFGLGVKSLVIQAIVHSSLSSLQMFMASPWRPSWQCDIKEIRRIFGFSSNLVIYLNRNADSMIVGKLLGAVALGPYSLAFKIMLYPLQSIALVASKALYPVMSAHQTDPVALRGKYLQSVSFVALITAPLMGGLMALRVPFVAVALGAKWSGVAALLLWLAPVGFVQSVLSTAPAVFMVKGRTDWLLMLNFGMAMVHILCWLIGAHFGGLHGMAAAYLVATLISAPVYLALTAKLLDLRLSVLLGALQWQVVLGAGVFLAAYGVSRTLDLFALATLPHLLLAAALGAAYGLWHIHRFNPEQMSVLRRALHFT